jgi:hypothetical protein
MEQAQEGDSSKEIESTKSCFVRDQVWADGTPYGGFTVDNVGGADTINSGGHAICCRKLHFHTELKCDPARFQPQLCPQ